MGSFAAAGGGTLRNPLLWNPESARYCLSFSALSWLKSLVQHPWHFNALHINAWFPICIIYARIQASRHRKIVELLVVTSVSPGRRFRVEGCFSCSLPLQRKICFSNDSATLPKKLLSSWHVVAQFSRWLRKLIDKNKLHSIRNCLPPTFYGSSFGYCLTCLTPSVAHPFASLVLQVELFLQGHVPRNFCTVAEGGQMETLTNKGKAARLREDNS